MYVSLFWLTNIDMTMCKSPLENITNEFILTSPAYLIHLIWRVCETESKWQYSCCFVGCCKQDLFKKACRILVYFHFIFFFVHFVSINVVQPYSSTDAATTWKKSCFILSERSDFPMINNWTVAVYAFTKCMLISLSVGEILLLRYVNWSINSRGLLLKWPFLV